MYKVSIVSVVITIYLSMCSIDMYKVFAVISIVNYPSCFWSIYSNCLLLCFWWDFEHTWTLLMILQHDCFSLIGPHQVKKYLHTLFNLAWCDIKGSYKQYCSIQGLNVARLLLQWLLIILWTYLIWYCTLLDSVHCPFHIWLREVLYKVYISMACMNNQRTTSPL